MISIIKIKRLMGALQNFLDFFLIMLIILGNKKILCARLKSFVNKKVTWHHNKISNSASDDNTANMSLAYIVLCIVLLFCQRLNHNTWNLMWILNNICDQTWVYEKMIYACIITNTSAIKCESAQTQHIIKIRNNTWHRNKELMLYHHDITRTSITFFSPHFDLQQFSHSSTIFYSGCSDNLNWCYAIVFRLKLLSLNNQLSGMLLAT